MLLRLMLGHLVSVITRTVSAVTYATLELVGHILYLVSPLPAPPRCQLLFKVKSLQGQRRFQMHFLVQDASKVQYASEDEMIRRDKDNIDIDGDVTSADSQSLSILGTSFPDRAPSHGPSLLYAQRENRLIIEDSRLPLSSVCCAGGDEEKKRGRENLEF